MENTNKALDRLIQEGYEFQFNKYISDGFNIFLKNIGGFVGYYVIIMLIVLVSSFVVWGAGSLLQPIFLAGVFIVANEIIQGRTPDFSLFFRGFNHFIQLFLSGLITSIFIGIGMILLIVPGIYLAVSYQFANLFIIFLGYDFWPAMEYSRKIITKQWWSFFAFLIIISLINLAGALALGIGILFTAPATMCMIFCAFEDIVGSAVRRSADENNNNQNYTYTSV